VRTIPGVTVERKEGAFVTRRDGRSRWSTCPHLFVARTQPDEEITRDFVLGRASGETALDLVLCVADSTNLRLTIRLLLELKSTGRPLALGSTC